MGDYKLKANISRFAMENSGFVDQPEVKSNRPNVAGVGDRSRLFNVRDFRSYSDVMGKAKVAGGYSKETRGNQVPEKRECEKVLVVPDRTVAFKELLGLAVVGKTVDLETLVDFDRLLRIIGTVYLKIQYLGGLSILIAFNDEATEKRFLEARVIWGPWFSKLEAWSG
ncbi:hypothetical protein HanXRQr2_Chr15g0683551 [Helianthus annuus]|uniref:DUF4283 domain-containing protein n=1 Tax=Helianthus annuus TaxID=4232 RepID=A0A9K3DY50_HELAN|nr:hypothetical protein HanXRQr2_Chr15g0683551 [Helianthus annuus]KAJ0454634.1 hypothetical protein HanIR_Chr15g0742341 [Helianthus annuus]KAJ0472340.1 hypothetical protein HanHA89_Chr15g0605951 [Helianthus annuus]